MQEETTYSPRQFVALVRHAAENVSEDLAHREMDISRGEHRDNKGDVADNLAEAENTVEVTESLHSERKRS